MAEDGAQSAVPPRVTIRPRSTHRADRDSTVEGPGDRAPRQRALVVGVRHAIQRRRGRSRQGCRNIGDRADPARRCGGARGWPGRRAGHGRPMQPRLRVLWPCSPVARRRLVLRRSSLSRDRPAATVSVPAGGAARRVGALVRLSRRRLRSAGLLRATRRSDPIPERPRVSARAGRGTPRRRLIGHQRLRRRPSEPFRPYLRHGRFPATSV